MGCYRGFPAGNESLEAELRDLRAENDRLLAQNLRLNELLQVTETPSASKGAIDDKTIDRVCFAICNTHDSNELWAHTRKDPDVFRQAARLGLRYLAQRLELLEAEKVQLEQLLNTPEILDFIKAVQLEAAHQRKRWGTEHDAGKSDADWFWLIGYLGGKALHNPCPEGQVGWVHEDQLEKQLHRIITVAAAAANWHAAKLGKTNMRPGIAPPKEGS